MIDDSTTQCLLFPEIFAKPIVARFDQTNGSSDGGAIPLKAAAYVLMQELRLKAAHTSCARAQVLTRRERLLKLGARVLGSVRRLVVHLPAPFPLLPTFQQVALALGASPG